MLKKPILLHNLNISDNKERYNERRQKKLASFSAQTQVGKGRWLNGEGKPGKNKGFQ